MTGDDLVVVCCPCCGKEQEDLDGFGVVFCAACGFCAHISVTGDICGTCGRNVEVMEGRKPVEYRDASTGELVFWSATGPNQKRPPQRKPSADDSPKLF